MEVEEVGLKRQLKKLRDGEAEEEAVRAAAREAEREAQAEKRRRARQEQEERTRQAEERQRNEEAQRQRRSWASGWVQWVLSSLPHDAPPEVALGVRDIAEETLAKINLSDPRELIERLLLAARDRALQPWVRRKEIENAIQEAPNQLPELARGFSNSSQWGARAMRMAAEEMKKLPTDAPLSVIRAAAIEAGKNVAVEYHRAEAVEEHRRACQRMVDSTFLPGASIEQMQAARQAVRESLAKLAVGCGSSAIRDATDKALAPFQKQIACAKAANDYLGILSHVGDHLRQLEADQVWDFESLAERWEIAGKIKKMLTPELSQQFLQGKLDPKDREEVHAWVEKRVEDYLNDHFGDF